MNQHENEGNKPTRFNQDYWHLDKRLNVGHILTTLTIVFAFFVWANKIDARITTLEIRQAANIDTSREIKGQLILLNDKLDKLLVKLYENKK